MQWAIKTHIVTNSQEGITQLKSRLER